MSLVIDLPFPPSTNRLWRTGKSTVYRSPNYILWISQADKLYLTQKVKLKPKMLPGKFEAILHLWTGDGRVRKDADNRMKAPLDFAVRMGLIVDDQYCEKGTFQWVQKEQAPYGARLTLIDLETEPR